MKWIYGKQDWKIFERGQENCYLMTNGLGGYSSLTMTGSAARNDHAFLMACTKAPNNRYNMITGWQNSWRQDGEFTPCHPRNLRTGAAKKVIGI